MSVTQQQSAHLAIIFGIDLLLFGLSLRSCFRRPRELRHRAFRSFALGFSLLTIVAGIVGAGVFCMNGKQDPLLIFFLSPLGEWCFLSFAPLGLLSLFYLGAYFFFPRRR